jgi:hypothetical protein
VVDPESALPRSLSLPPDVDLLAGRLRLVIDPELAGLTGALVLLGVPMPAGTLPLAATHGVLMTLGFLGTLIALERAVALGRSWGYAAPVGAGLGAMALVRRLPATGIPATDPDSIERACAGIARKYAGDSATDAMIGPVVLDTIFRLEPS